METDTINRSVVEPSTVLMDPTEPYGCENDDTEALALLEVGMWVRCERSRASAGTWPRFAGRVGRIVTVNEGEFGVRFTAGTAESATWFLGDELVEIDLPLDAPKIRTHADRKAGA